MMAFLQWGYVPDNAMFRLNCPRRKSLFFAMHSVFLNSIAL